MPRAPAVLRNCVVFFVSLTPPAHKNMCDWINLIVTLPWHINLLIEKQGLQMLGVAWRRIFIFVNWIQCNFSFTLYYMTIYIYLWERASQSTNVVCQSIRAQLMARPLCWTLTELYTPSQQRWPLFLLGKGESDRRHTHARSSHTTNPPVHTVDVYAL